MDLPPAVASNAAVEQFLHALAAQRSKQPAPAGWFDGGQYVEAISHGQHFQPPAGDQVNPKALELLQALSQMSAPSHPAPRGSGTVSPMPLQFPLHRPGFPNQPHLAEDDPGWNSFVDGRPRLRIPQLGI